METKTLAPPKKAAAAPRARKSLAAKKPAVRVFPNKAMPPRPELDEKLAKAIQSGLEDAKAEAIVSIDLRDKTTLADLMIIASGRSSVHVGAIADRVMKACKAAGYPAPRVEGMPHCDWVLLDAADAIIHIFRPDVRQFYNLEKLWSADRPDEGRQSLKA